MIIYKMIRYKFQRKRMSVETLSNDAESMAAMLISISMFFLVNQIPVIVVVMAEK